MLVRMHSRQKISPPVAQTTGSRAMFKQSMHDENGRNDVRDSLLDCVPHVPLSRALSCDVKNASPVFRLPVCQRFSKL